MNLLSKLKNKSVMKNIPMNIEIDYELGKIYAPISGRYMPLSEVPDQVFASGMMGIGCGIEPQEGRVYSPVSGTVVSIAETKHFVGLNTDNGTGFLIHIGMDTVELQGKGFQSFISEGQRVRCGELIMTFDMDYIKKSGYSITSAFVMAEAKTDVQLEIVENGIYNSGKMIGTVK